MISRGKSLDNCSIMSVFDFHLNKEENSVAKDGTKRGGEKITELLNALYGIIIP